MYKNIEIINSGREQNSLSLLSIPALLPKEANQIMGGTSTEVGMAMGSMGLDATCTKLTVVMCATEKSLSCTGNYKKDPCCECDTLTCGKYKIK
jgi:hypothetical protein